MSLYLKSKNAIINLSEIIMFELKGNKIIFYFKNKELFTSTFNTEHEAREAYNLIFDKVTHE